MYRSRRVTLLKVFVCVLAILPTGSRATDHVEIRVELESTFRSQRLTNQHSVRATCIVSSNEWFISGNFLRNARIEYWLVGTNVIEHRTITSSMYLDQARNFVSEKILGAKPRPMFGSYPRAGETFTTIHPSPLGQPAFYAIEGAVWLAFCSGRYLKQPGRQVPMPVGDSSHAFGYADKTTVYQDQAGLPKTVELFATNGTLVCHYEVLQTTNYFGRIFPLRFRVLQRGEPDRGAARSTTQSELVGEVISIKPTEPHRLPAELRKKIP